MVSFTIFAGGYESFIAAYVLNVTCSTASLSLQAKIPSGDNPSWITANADRSVLYAVNEIPVGAVQSFSICSNGTLSGPIDTVSSGGNGPAHCVQLSNGDVATMNYGSGNGSFTPTIDGKYFNRSPEASAFVTFPPPPLPNISNPHMTLEHHDGDRDQLYVPDLGGDKIWRLDSRNYQIIDFIPQSIGSGPRHIAINNGYLYILREKDNNLVVHALDGTVTYANHTIIPPNPPPGAVYAAAEILIPPTSSQYPDELIYVSNRNIGKPAPEGDSIAIFKHVIIQGEHALVLIKQVFTKLDQIRGMEIGNKDNGGDQYLIAGAFSGEGGVAVYERIDQGKDLRLVARNTEVANRTSFVWA